jgi:hypothetical protein
LSLVPVQSLGTTQHWPEPGIPQALMLGSLREQRMLASALESEPQASSAMQGVTPNWHSPGMLAEMPRFCRSVSFQ